MSSSSISSSSSTPLLLPPYEYCPEDLMESFHALQKQQQQQKEQAKEEEEIETKQTSLSPSTPLPAQSFTVAAVQLTASGLPSSSLDGFWQRAQQAVELAATQHDASLILLPELFLGPYFCQSQEACLQGLALTSDNNNNFVLSSMQRLAKTHRVVLPISFFERQNNVLYNSVTVIDADGSILGTYRKSHIPDGTGYQEKFYFTPGDTGFRVFTSRVFGFTIGVAICWDQWFPEAARAMALQGADILMYPTAIGTEPQDPTIDSSGHWQRVMQGHAAANVVPVVASNRYGTEILLSHSNNNNNNDINNKTKIEKQRITFYGRSFITDATGAIVKEVISMNNGDMQQQDQQQQQQQKEDHQRCISIITSTIDPEANRAQRLAWGLFRDRRPELYGILQTKDGSQKGI
ncbi:hydrolase [Nitzschia inconspicua]|uniref:Hydrolase n=1 Tax=Nitzschia inconspicua TaxID=303405 RepID=A0A9K3PYP5_9STRA|nr:hydrolase [Nitzschia inconspicua]